MLAVIGCRKKVWDANSTRSCFEKKCDSTTKFVTCTACCSVFWSEDLSNFLAAGGWNTGVYFLMPLEVAQPKEHLSTLPQSIHDSAHVRCGFSSVLWASKNGRPHVLHRNGFSAAASSTTSHHQHHYTIRHTRCCFNVRSEADMSQLNLPHGTNSLKVKNKKTEE